MIKLKAFLEEQRKLESAATPGPWKYSPADECDDWQVYNSEFTFVKQDDSGVPVSKEDGELLIASRNNYSRLLDAVEMLMEATSYSECRTGATGCTCIKDVRDKALAVVEELLTGEKK